MRRVFVSSLLLIWLLNSCSKNDGQKPAAAPSAPAPALILTSTPAPATSQPQLIITNAPAKVSPVAKSVEKIEKGIEVKGAGNLYLTFPKSWMDKLSRVQEKENGSITSCSVRAPEENLR